VTQQRNEALPATMSVLLALASQGTSDDRVAVASQPDGRHARRAGAGEPDDHGAEITLVLPRPDLGATISRIGRRSSAPPVSPIQPLPDRLSARRLLSGGQAVILVVVLGAVAGLLSLRLVTGIGPSPLAWAQCAVAAVTAMYIVVVGFRLLLVLAAPSARVIDFTHDEVQAIDDRDLPVYTVLVPLYREEKVLRTLVDKLSRLNYPPARLQILLLIEEDDELTRKALRKMPLEEQFEVVVIPPRYPRTKPKACNEGLRHARGEFCVIFDAEDRPEPDQLRKAVAAFRCQPQWVVCVQAELQYWNPWTNWLTRFFAAEYALNFSLVLRGLDRFGLPIPLGGTSNHFRTDALRQLGGWDPFNVAEDADLGMRIARRGWAVRVMASVTEEEANSKVGNWIRQRSRWIKGYFQTWLVHMRSPWRLWRDLGARQFIGMQLTVGFATLTGLLNPVFWALTCLYLVVGPAPISPFFPPPVLLTGLLTMLIGNLLMVEAMMAGCMARGLHRALRSMLLVPLYWGMMSLAAYKALLQLLRPSRRHYWELTTHGLVADHGDARQLRPHAVAEPIALANEQ
jgi:cellulose synthase/poly-beta-1,6-N-acetylglucosamine synthase-like glycosyltransferase